MAEEYNNRVVMGGTKWWDSSTTTSLSSSTSSVVFSDHQSLHMMGLDLQDGLPSMYAGEKPFLSTGEASPELMKPVKGTFSVDQFSHASSSGIFQALMESPPPMQSGYGYSQAVGYGNSDNLMPNCNWTITTSSNKIHHEIPQFLKVSSNQQHRFINDINSHGGSSWNAVADPRPPPFFPTPLLQPPQLAPPTFHDKHHHKNNVMAVRNTSGAGRKSNRGSGRTSTASTTSTGSATAKRPRKEDSSNLPPFKVRKEKMGDRITALQQLVSPFGKTDTASVLSEAIEYIKFLHEQVNVLSTPYLKSGASLQQQQQIHDKFKDPEATRKDLKSRGLCLVPVSSTFPVAHETTMDFWTPAFGSTTFR